MTSDQCGETVGAAICKFQARATVEAAPALRTGSTTHAAVVDLLCGTSLASSSLYKQLCVCHFRTASYRRYRPSAIGFE